MVGSGGKKTWLAGVSILLGLGMQAAFSADVDQILTMHLYSPWKDDATRNKAPAFIEASGSSNPIPFRGLKMVSEGGDWYVATTPVSARNPSDGYMTFLFANYLPTSSDPYGPRLEYGMDGASTPFRLDSLFFSKKITEVWIIPQGPGKHPIIQDYAPPKKVLAFFNPWALGAPAVKIGAAAAYKNMRPAPEGQGRCGWYVYYFSDEYSATAPSMQVSFNNILGGETYGAGGIKDSKGIELQTLFATHDTVFIVSDTLPGITPKLVTAFPSGVLGTCTFNLAVTIRDFSAAHPDFEESRDGKEDGNLGTKNMILPTLGPDKKPKRNPASKYPFSSKLDSWFVTDSTNATPGLRNYQSCYDLPISKSSDGYWKYSSLEENNTGFFPLGDPLKSHFPADPLHMNCYTTDFASKSCNQTAPAGNPTAVANQNFNFCMEMHANFKYQKGQRFSFVGDDDVWVFINNQLVIDLGGAHWPIQDSVDLDKISGLAVDQKYDFDLFYCERQFSGSNLFIKTSIYFEQKQSLYHQLVSGSTDQWDIYERISGDKSCGATDSDKVALATVDFTLSGPSISPPVPLTGTSHGGGIVIDPSNTRVTVDTSKIHDLPAGVYTITYTSRATKKPGSLLFTIVSPPQFQVATPVPSPTGAAFTASPTAAGVTLTDATAGASIFYTLDGTLPDTLVKGATKLYAPGSLIPISGITTIKAVAAKQDWKSSEIISETYSPPVSVAKAFYQDADGDGRIDRVTIDFDKDLAVPPLKLSFTLKNGGGTDETHDAAPAEIAMAAGSKTRVVVNLATPFSYGITSMAAAGSGHLFAQANIPLPNGVFDVADSVAPVIVGTDVQPADSANPFVRVVLTFSEPVTVPATGTAAIVFKHETAEYTPAQVIVRGISKLAENKYEFTIDSSSSKFPIVGDSVSINNDGQIKDMAANAPARKLFQKLGGTPPKAKPVLTYVTFPNGTNKPGHSTPGMESNAPLGVHFIPFDNTAHPLKGRVEDGKCENCYVGTDKDFVGPVINMEIPGPVEYEFKIFSNLGEFVVDGKGKIEEADLAGLTPIKNGTQYQARFVWNGRTFKDEKAGTGAYILAVKINIPRDQRTGALAATDMRKLVFGLLRN